MHVVSISKFILQCSHWIYSATNKEKVNELCVASQGDLVRYYFFIMAVFEKKSPTN